MGDVLLVGGFGPRRLVDLLTSLEAGQRREAPKLDLPLEEELWEILGTVGNPRQISIFIARKGLNRKGRLTLQACGDEFGVTRERIRQITSGMEERLAMGPISAPVLDSALACVSSLLPASVEHVEKTLEDKDFTRGEMTLGAILNFAELLNRPQTFTVISLAGGRVVVPSNRKA